MQADNSDYAQTPPSSRQPRRRTIPVPAQASAAWEPRELWHLSTGAQVPYQLFAFPVQPRPNPVEEQHRCEDASTAAV